jgi:hypothetical protein
MSLYKKETTIFDIVIHGPMDQIGREEQLRITLIEEIAAKLQIEPRKAN